MTALRLILILSALPLLAACAQVQKEHVARSVAVEAAPSQPGVAPVPASSIVVSAKMNNDLSSEYFGYFDVTLENKSDQWLVVSTVKVSFADSFQNENIRFVSGARFAQWQQAMTKIIAIDQQNKHTAMATIAALGVGMAALSGNRNMQALGTAAAGGAAGSYIASEHARRLDSLQNTKLFPENHLLGDSIVLPPGLFADRWLLINSSRHDEMEYVTALHFELETKDGKTEKHVLDFRPQRSATSPKWQRDVFTRKKYLIRHTNPSY